MNSESGADNTVSSLPDYIIKAAENQQARGTPRITYPNKIFSLAEHYIPENITDLFKFCKYYFLTNPILSQVIPNLVSIRSPM